MKFIRVAGCLGLLFAAVAGCFAQTYTVTDLGTVAGFSDARGINRFGQVVGYFGATDGYHAFRTAANSAINPAADDLGTLGGNTSYAFGINASGQVIGYSNIVTGNLNYHAFRTAGNSSINPATDDLGTLGGAISYANGVNESGQVVGVSSTAIGGWHAFRTAPNGPLNPATDDLGSLSDNGSEGTGINDSGQVVGRSWLSDGTMHAFRTAANSAINPATDDLGTLGGNTSYAFGINASGQVVGYSSTAGDSAYHAFRTAANSAINPTTDDLGTLGGPNSYAHGINTSGQVVGYSDTAGDGSHAFLYSQNVMHDLNDLIPADTGLKLQYAIGINDVGQIVGFTTSNHAFLLTPKSQYSCSGFEAPFNRVMIIKPKSHQPIPLKAHLVDANGVPVTATSIAGGLAPIVLVVSLDNPANSSFWKSFKFDATTNTWWINLDLGDFWFGDVPGTYEVWMKTADATQYTFNPECVGYFVRK